MYAGVLSHRNREREALERDRYIVMLHLHTLCHNGQISGVPRERIARDLALSTEREDRVVDDLIRAKMATDSGPGIALTARGIGYLTYGARRRRSIRFD